MLKSLTETFICSHWEAHASKQWQESIGVEMEQKDSPTQKGPGPADRTFLLWDGKRCTQFNMCWKGKTQKKRQRQWFNMFNLTVFIQEKKSSGRLLFAQSNCTLCSFAVFKNKSSRTLVHGGSWLDHKMVWYFVPTVPLMSEEFDNYSMQSLTMLWEEFAFWKHITSWPQ